MIKDLGLAQANPVGMPLVASVTVRVRVPQERLVLTLSVLHWTPSQNCDTVTLYSLTYQPSCDLTFVLI